jgi:solute carrier family 25 2-oxodicarboxylate transporter 21
MTQNDYLYIAGALSGVFEVLATHPLDTVKTKLQDSALNNLNKHNKNNLFECIKNIYNVNKFRGFYSGIMPRLYGIIPMRLVYWSSMTSSTDYIKKNDVDLRRNLNLYFNHNVSSFIINIMPGLITGCVQSLIDNPIEVLKIKLMTNANYNVNIVQQLSQMYQGFGYLLARNIFFVIPVAYSVKTYQKDNPFLAGAIGGIVGSIISQPFDVLKTERQRSKTNYTQKITLTSLIMNNPKSLFSGLFMRSSLNFINMGIGFSIFNYIYNDLYNKHK